MTSLVPVDTRAELTGFLKSRRAKLRPETVGLPRYGERRRVPGLRREELARLAGVSVTHYTRLEHGHGRNVSGEVLDAVAAALRLSGVEREHLIRHPEAGDLEIAIDVVKPGGEPDQWVVTFTAEPGSPSQKALRRLAGGE